MSTFQKHTPSAHSFRLVCVVCVALCGVAAAENQTLKFHYTSTAGPPIESTQPCNTTVVYDDQEYSRLEARALAKCHGPDPTKVNNTFLEYGCGACPPVTQGCKEFYFNTSWNIITCQNTYQPVQDYTYNFTCIAGHPTAPYEHVVPCSVQGTATDIAYLREKAVCHMPNQELVDNTYTDYGCGSCFDTSKTQMCLECAAGDDDNCNRYAEPEKQWRCYKGTEGSFLCQGKHAACFSATQDYEGPDTLLLKGGCGTCTAANFTAESCDTCAGGMCNSARAAVGIWLALTVGVVWFSRLL